MKGYLHGYPCFAGHFRYENLDRGPIRVVIAFSAIVFEMLLQRQTHRQTFFILPLDLDRARYHTRPFGKADRLVRGQPFPLNRELEADGAFGPGYPVSHGPDLGNQRIPRAGKQTNLDPPPVVRSP